MTSDEKRAAPRGAAQEPPPSVSRAKATTGVGRGLDERRAQRLEILRAYPSLSDHVPGWASRLIRWDSDVAGVHRDTGRVISVRSGYIFDPLEDWLPKPAHEPAPEPTLPTADQAPAQEPVQAAPANRTRRHLTLVLGRKGHRR